MSTFFINYLFIMSNRFPVSILKIFKDLKIKGDTGAGESEGLVSGTENTETHATKKFIITAKVSTLTTNGDLKVWSSLCCSSGSGSANQLRQQRSPNLPVLDHQLQLIGRDTEVIPSRPKYFFFFLQLFRKLINDAEYVSTQLLQNSLRLHLQLSVIRGKMSDHSK